MSISGPGGGGGGREGGREGERERGEYVVNSNTEQTWIGFQVHHYMHTYLCPHIPLKMNVSIALELKKQNGEKPENRDGKWVYIMYDCTRLSMNHNYLGCKLHRHN